MQVFLPFPDYKKSASVIDDKRLWKQILEIDGIIRIIAGERQGYKNHPVVKMWWDHASELKCYRHELVNEWLRRRLWEAPQIDKQADVGVPAFVDEKFCQEMKDKLLNKNFNHYSKVF